MKICKNDKIKDNRTHPQDVCSKKEDKIFPAFSIPKAHNIKYSKECKRNE